MMISDKLQDYSYSLFRIVSGFLFLWHGTQKIFDYPVAFKYELSPLTMAAGYIELLGGALIMIGLFTRPAAFICSGTMAVAYWLVHGLNAPFPIMNGGELSAMYCFAFLMIATKGSGALSIDSKLF